MTQLFAVAYQTQKSGRLLADLLEFWIHRGGLSRGMRIRTWGCARCGSSKTAPGKLASRPWALGKVLAVVQWWWYRAPRCACFEGNTWQLFRRKKSPLFRTSLVRSDGSALCWLPWTRAWLDGWNDSLSDVCLWRRYQSYAGKSPSSFS